MIKTVQRSKYRSQIIKMYVYCHVSDGVPELTYQLSSHRKGKLTRASWDTSYKYDCNKFLYIFLLWMNRTVVSDPYMCKNYRNIYVLSCYAMPVDGWSTMLAIEKGS
jgi:hypothetical protein